MSELSTVRIVPVDADCLDKDDSLSLAVQVKKMVERLNDADDKALITEKESDSLLKWMGCFSSEISKQQKTFMERYRKQGVFLCIFSLFGFSALLYVLLMPFDVKTQLYAASGLIVSAVIVALYSLRTRYLTSKLGFLAENLSLKIMVLKSCISTKNLPNKEDAMKCVYMIHDIGKFLEKQSIPYIQAEEFTPLYVIDIRTTSFRFIDSSNQSNFTLTSVLVAVVNTKMFRKMKPGESV